MWGYLRASQLHIHAPYWRTWHCPLVICTKMIYSTVLPINSFTSSILFLFNVLTIYYLYFMYFDLIYFSTFYIYHPLPATQYFVTMLLVCNVDLLSAFGGVHNSPLFVLVLYHITFFSYLCDKCKELHVHHQTIAHGCWPALHHYCLPHGCWPTLLWQLSIPWMLTNPAVTVVYPMDADQPCCDSYLPYRCWPTLLWQLPTLWMLTDPAVTVVYPMDADTTRRKYFWKYIPMFKHFN